MTSALAAPMPRARTSQPTVLMRATTWLLLLSLSATALPETVFGRFYVAELPVEFVLFYAGVFCCGLSLAAGRTGVMSSWLLLALAAGGYMAILGLASGNSPHFFVVDSSQFAGFVVGIIWARQRRLTDVADSMGRLGGVLTVLLIVNIVGLMTGTIDPANKEGERIYTNGLFESTRLLSILLPLLFLLVSTQPTVRRKRGALRRAQTASAAVALAAVMASTRSILITWFASMLLIAWFSMACESLLRRLLLIAVGFGVLQSAALILDQSDIGLIQRLKDTRVRDEQRYCELEMMFDSLEGRSLVGTGFGSRFNSCIVADGDTLAHAPHVAVLTLWLKGGFLVFLSLIVLPLLRAMAAIARIHHRRARESERLLAGLAASVLLYIASAALSGGWSFSALFLYGAAVGAIGSPADGIAQSGRRRRVSLSAGDRIPLGALAVRQDAGGEASAAQKRERLGGHTGHNSGGRDITAPSGERGLDRFSPAA